MLGIEPRVYSKGRVSFLLSIFLVLIKLKKGSVWFCLLGGRVNSKKLGFYSKNFIIKKYC